MDFNTEQATVGIKQIASMVSELVVRATEAEEQIGIEQIEQGMREMLQEVGR